VKGRVGTAFSGAVEVWVDIRGSPG
jgi:hypothetical protein